MEHLTKVRGGDGEGISYFKTPNVTIDKSVNRTPKKSAEIIENNKNNLIGDQFFYHTRKASKGNIIDLNVQPFKSSNTTAFCHNGTWHKSDDWARTLLMTDLINFKNYMRLSDTKIILMMIKKVGFQFLDLVDNGVFMEFEKTQATLSLYSGQFEACQIDDVWYYASTFNKIHDNHVKFKTNTKAKLTPSGYTLIKGEVEEIKESAVVNYNSINYYGYNNNNRFNKSNRIITTKTSEDNSEKIKTMWKERNKNVVTIFSAEGKPVYKYNKTTGEEIDLNVNDKPLKENKGKRGNINRRERNKLTKKLMKEEPEQKETIEIEENKDIPIVFKIEDAEKILKTEKHLAIYKEIVFNSKSPVHSKQTILEFCPEDESTTLKSLIIRMLRDFNYDRNTIIRELGFTFYTPDIFLPYLKKEYEHIISEFIKVN